MTEFSIDPEFRDLLPRLSEDERQRLLVDINANGCRDKLVVWKEWNILIDGHNRYEICTDLDISYETTELSFPSRDDVKLWMIRNQLARRNITDAKRVALNLMLKPVLAAKAKEKQELGVNQHTKSSLLQNSAEGSAAVEKLDTRAEIAKASGVSHDTVRKVETVMKTADEPTKEKMLSGEISVNKAFKAVKADVAAPVIKRQAPEVSIPERRVEQLGHVPDASAQTPEPLTAKQSEGWFAVSKELFGQIRDYCRKCPAARLMVVKDLKKLAKSIEGKQA